MRAIKCYNNGFYNLFLFACCMVLNQYIIQSKELRIPFIVIVFSLVISIVVGCVYSFKNDIFSRFKYTLIAIVIALAANFMIKIIMFNLIFIIVLGVIDTYDIRKRNFLVKD